MKKGNASFPTKPPMQIYDRILRKQNNYLKKARTTNRVDTSASNYLTAGTSLTPELPKYVQVSHTAVHSDLGQFPLIPPLSHTVMTSDSGF
jgi:hypothetical protein